MTWMKYKIYWDLFRFQMIYQSWTELIMLSAPRQQGDAIAYLECQVRQKSIAVSSTPCNVEIVSVPRYWTQWGSWWTPSSKGWALILLSWSEQICLWLRPSWILFQRGYWNHHWGPSKHSCPALHVAGKPLEAKVVLFLTSSPNNHSSWLDTT